MSHPFILVVGVDFSDLSVQALRVARNLAQGRAGAVVHAVVAVASSAEPERISDDEHVAEAAAKLEQFLASELAISAGDAPLVARVAVGSPETVLSAYTATVHADLLVLGTHGRHGLERLVFGSVAGALVREAPCSVLVVRERRIAAEETIEPPCAACVAVRAKLQDEAALCATHEERVARKFGLAGGDTFGLGALDFHIAGV